MASCWQGVILVLMAQVVWGMPVSAKEAVHEGVAGIPPMGGIFKVATVRGEVLVWRRFGASWNLVSIGDSLVSGELVQLAAGAALKLKGVVSGTGEKVPRGFLLKTETALITRIDERTFREIDLGGFFFSAKGMEAPAKKDAEPSPLVTAWRHMLSVLDEGTKPEDTQALAARLGDGEKDPTQDDGEVILIDHPKNGETYIVGALPTEMAVTWSKQPVGVKSLKVFFWKSDQGNPVNVGQTDQMFFRLPVSTPGRYYVRLESPDGRWRSKSHLFVMLTADEIASSLKKPDPSGEPTSDPVPTQEPRPP